MRVTERTIELLRERNIFTQAYRLESRFKAGDPIFVHKDAKIEAYSAVLKGSTFPSLGMQTYTHSPFLPNTIIGRYTSLASGIRFMGDQHPYQRFTSHSITYSTTVNWVAECIKNCPDFSFRMKPKPVSQPTVIENDVWIGANVVLKQGIKVGTGG